MNYRKGVDAPSQVFSLDTLINEMRLIKDAHESKTMKYPQEYLQKPILI